MLCMWCQQIWHTSDTVLSGLKQLDEWACRVWESSHGCDCCAMNEWFDIEVAVLFDSVEKLQLLVDMLNMSLLYESIFNNYNIIEITTDSQLFYWIKLYHSFYEKKYIKIKLHQWSLTTSDYVLHIVCSHSTRIKFRDDSLAPQFLSKNGIFIPLGS